MHRTTYALRSRKLGLLASVGAAALGIVTTSAGAADPDNSADRVHTTTPIKHVIVVLAENGGFDHVFGTFRPRNGQHIGNLLSRGIVKADGTPARSRDNLPNPIMDEDDNRYVPRNMPAIGDLMEMFDFGAFGNRGDQDDHDHHGRDQDG